MSHILVLTQSFPYHATTMATEEPDYSKIPVQPPPPGVSSNFVDPPDRDAAVAAVSALLIALSTTFVLLRLYTRLVLVRRFEIGDCLLVIGYGFAVANSAVTIHQTTVGLGRHGWDIPMSTMFPHNLKHTYLGMILYIVSLGFTKTTILCLYPRISPTPAFRMCVWVMMGIVVCWAVSAFIWSILYCIPISDFWSLEAALGDRCPPKISFLAFTGASNVVTDLAILALPIVVLRHLNLPTKKKIGVAIILATGSFVSIISVVRLVKSIQSYTSDDLAYKILNVLLWSSTELHTAVVCACMPTLRPFLRSCASSLKGISVGSNTKSLQSRQRTVHQSLEREEDGYIELRKLNAGTAPSSYHEESGTVVDVERNRHNMSEESILRDENSISAERPGNLWKERDLGKNNGLEIRTV